jgi:hypothetical protein
MKSPSTPSLELLLDEDMALSGVEMESGGVE